MVEDVVADRGVLSLQEPIFFLMGLSLNITAYFKIVSRIP